MTTGERIRLPRQLLKLNRISWRVILIKELKLWLEDHAKGRYDISRDERFLSRGYDEFDVGITFEDGDTEMLFRMRWL